MLGETSRKLRHKFFLADKGKHTEDGSSSLLTSLCLPRELGTGAPICDIRELSTISK